jgi:hypothetical protein
MARRTSRRRGAARPPSPLEPQHVLLASPATQRLMAGLGKAEHEAHVLIRSLDELVGHHETRKLLALWQRENLEYLRTTAQSLRLQLRGHQSFVTLEVGRG